MQVYLNSVYSESLYTRFHRKIRICANRQIQLWFEHCTSFSFMSRNRSHPSIYRHQCQGQAVAFKSILAKSLNKLRAHSEEQSGRTELISYIGNSCPNEKSQAQNQISSTKYICKWHSHRFPSKKNMFPSIGFHSCTITFTYNSEPYRLLGYRECGTEVIP